jgi:flagellar biogenesis protein FliO
MRRCIGILALLLSLLGIAAAPAGPYENQPIGRGQAATTTTANSPGSGTQVTGLQGWVRLAMSLVIVLVLILALRPVMRRLMGSAAIRSSRAIQVLSTQVIAPRQQLILLRVGKRLVLVGNGGAGMSTLCEIQDPDEVAQLLGQLSSDKPSATRTFGAMLGLARKRGDGDAETQLSNEPIADDEPVAAVSQPGQESLFATRDELSGLSDKVRRLSQQFQ